MPSSWLDERVSFHHFRTSEAETREYFLSAIPRKEFGRSEEIATAALFLASDDSSFVNGSEICVDGGLAQI